jgi:hypothetical protein
MPNEPGDTGGNGVVPMKNDCTGMDAKLAELLLDPAAAPAKVHAHVAGCERCRRELEELRAIMVQLDHWKAPEPSPYFLSRLEARLREERAAEPAGWLMGGLARLRAGFAYGPATHVRPLAAMAMTILLLVGGGTYLGVTDWNQPPATPEQAVVHDLQTMDSNAQLLDQLETLSSSNESGD